MPRRYQVALFALALIAPWGAWAASPALITTLVHLLESKGLSAPQAQTAAATAKHRYPGSALAPIVTSVKGIRRLPATYYAHGALKRPVANGLTHVLLAAFTQRAAPQRVRGATNAYTRAVAQGAPPQTTGQLLIHALQHGANTARLKALVAAYLRQYKAGASAQNALHNAEGKLAHYGL